MLNPAAFFQQIYQYLYHSLHQSNDKFGKNIFEIFKKKSENFINLLIPSWKNSFDIYIIVFLP